MSDEENHHHGKNEILIIKRHGGGDHDGNHGGAWKIAYADFMTAMMAFFLVMWLVNAANEETKASVASYFNPIRLSEEKPSEKGLKKPVEKADGKEKQNQSENKEDKETIGASAATGEDATATSGDQTNYSEADFFENPYSVLAEIAQEVGQQANVSAKGEGGASDSGPSTGADGGEAYRDPFDPDFWTQQVQSVRGKPGPQAAKEAPGALTADKPSSAPGDQTDVDVAMLPADKTPALQVVPQAKPETPDTAADKGTDPGTEKADAAKAADGDKDKAAKAEKQQKDADALKAAIEKQISGVAGKLAEGLIVTPTEGGMLVTLSDQSDEAMFNVGSAVPSKETVLAMEKIGTILKDRPGAIVIRGHTDARPFAGKTQDNWGLSADRARSAYYMLVRGGLDQSRVKQISGFADRRLQVPGDPLSAANRRIEILIQADQG
ncbi:MotB family protein [Rhizobium halophytocola]|uniref:Chemotaxis protein MotB n=1 Tax=Rhizobium halophytocola TaxID=735519 RepID=A0ABS4E5A3_9HYPH|nr:MotB family protein [Rhizobium halophytocola]MBP1853130.1 chemotaxis protein MotB [Rhizobium halophytocola]